MRKLKYHEQKLLKKVSFYNWDSANDREVAVMRRYHLQNREDYSKYNKLCGYITRLTTLLKKLKPDDPFRIHMTQHLLERLYTLGVIQTQSSLLKCEKISVSAFCRRRLPVVMVKLKLAENLKEAVQFIEQGHIRVGPQTIMDPAFHVTRNMEDLVTWTQNSAIRRKVLKYHDKLDDYELL